MSIKKKVFLLCVAAMLLFSFSISAQTMNIGQEDALLHPVSAESDSWYKGDFSKSYTYAVKAVGAANAQTFTLANTGEEDNSQEEALLYPMLAERDSWYKSSLPKSSITAIDIVDVIDAQTAASASESWPAATDKNGDGELDDDIMCYLIGTKIVIVGNGSGRILMNYNSEYVFSDSSESEDFFSNLASISNMDILDTSKVTSMGKMFLNACLLKTVDVSGFDTSRVTDMSYMFASYIAKKPMAFESLDVGNWDTSNVQNMDRMFQLCTKLASIDVGSWETGNVVLMCGMFQTCSSLSTLDVSNWNTSNVVNMSFMFHNNDAIPLGSLDVSNWDVSKVLSFDHFIAHSKLTLTGVENWKNSVVVVMNAMFHMCQNKVLDVSGFDTSNVITFDQMFEGCNQLTEIIGLENFSTSNSVGFSEMFSNCQRLTKLNLESFDTRNAANDIQISSNGKTSKTLYHMFNGTLRLREIKIGENFSFNGDGTNTIAENRGVFRTPTSNYISGTDGNWYNEVGTAFAPVDVPDKTAGTYYAAFPGVPGMIASGNTWYKGTVPRSSVTRINISNSYTVTGNETESWDASSLNDASVMCYINGTELTIASNGTDRVKAHRNSSYMFSSNSEYFANLESITGLDALDTSMTINMSYMFKGCSNITSLDLSGFDTSKVTNMNEMFRNCTKLTAIYVSKAFNTDAVTTSSMMFTGCSKLTGGNGTSYDADNTDCQYAVIDTAEAKGYFTEAEMAFVNTKYSADDKKLEVSVLIGESLKQKNALVIIALYNENGLLDIYNTTSQETVAHTFENLPAGENGFTVRAFCWNNFERVVPLCKLIERTVR